MQSLREANLTGTSKSEGDSPSLCVSDSTEMGRTRYYNETDVSVENVGRCLLVCLDEFDELELGDLRLWKCKAGDVFHSFSTF